MLDEIIAGSFRFEYCEYNYEIFQFEAKSVKLQSRTVVQPLWLKCCFRNVLCQREDDNEFIVADFKRQNLVVVLFLVVKYRAPWLLSEPFIVAWLLSSIMSVTGTCGLKRFHLKNQKNKDR